MRDLAERMLDLAEGVRRTAYQDSRGFWTIGRGCLVDSRVQGAGLCNEAIEAQSAHDSQAARELASKLTGFDDCNDVQRAVLISMCFQLGSLEHWPEFRAALAAKDYSRAAEAGMSSAWAHQTPNRAKWEMQMLASGQWLEYPT